MIYFAAYIFLGISTAVYALCVLEKGERAVPPAVMGLVWPLVWIMAISNSIRGLTMAKCAWCGKTVANQYHLEKWRLHYLDECDKHPLAVKARRLENYLDETDAKNTANRVLLEAARVKISELEEDDTFHVIAYRVALRGVCEALSVFTDPDHGPVTKKDWEFVLRNEKHAWEMLEND